MLIYTVDGKCINKYQPFKWSLGIKTVEWLPSGQLLAIGSYDQKVTLLEKKAFKTQLNISFQKKVRILNHITFKSIMEFDHPLKISSKDLV